jgi:periplasmic glucans biosynthesis protein
MDGVHIHCAKRQTELGRKEKLVMPTVDRRSFIKIAGSAAVVAPSGLSPLQAQTRSGALQFLTTLMQDGSAFDASLIQDAARQLAQRAFVPPNTTIPEPFTSLNAEGYHAITHRPERRIWADEAVGYQIEPLHRGSIFTTPVLLSTVEQGLVKRIIYDPTRYSLGRLSAPSSMPDMNFSGFKLMQKGEPAIDFAIFQGATFYRSRAKGQEFGAASRALAIKTGDPRGEEFPIFRAFWIEHPGSDGIVTVHAVADSESATAAFRFTLRPGDMTIIDTECTIFARVDIDHIGIGPIQGTYLFGPSRRRNIDDLRSQVHDVHGLQMLNGRNEWIWRPLNNPEQLQISSFMDDNPKGFGLIQRDRDFNAYQDDEHSFERRPTIWMEPIGDWGAGSVQLTEIPSNSEMNDNIIAYWRPRDVLIAGSRTSFTYRQFWCWVTPERGELAETVGFRVGRGGSGRRRRCMVEFAGDILGGEIKGLTMALSASPGQIINGKFLHNSTRKSVRVTFELEPLNDAPSEIRLLLNDGDKPISETWLYRWTQ